MMDQRWLLYAILSAACAAVIPILGKLGMRGIDSNLATGVRSVFMTIFLVGFCLLTGVAGKLPTLHRTALVAIALSGVAGAASWLFYFKALQLGSASRVAPIDKLSMPLAVLLAVVVLRERFTLSNWSGVGLIVAGAWLAAR